ncbi:MAG: winged helix-turn-helix domain-containing protein, partial [Actinomycetota bacterium]|nr:winged helix-turn-helix domain-containing protein [Actinomycetota bacterium]
DPELRFTWSWGSGLGDLGLEENEVVGMTFFEYFETDDPNFPAIENERRALSGEHVHYEIDWHGRSYRCTVEPHFDEAGRVVGTIGIAVDLGASDSFEEARDIGRALSAARVAGEAAWPTGHEILEVNDLRIDVEAFEATRNGERLELTPTEFRLLTELARRPGRVVSRATLLRNVWGYDFLGGGSLITMAIKRLRSKIERDPTHPRIIETVRGVGYRLRAD